MKILYLDCSMGAAGDMLAAALYELIEDKKAYLEKLNSLGIPGVRFEALPDEKNGISGTHMQVTVNGEEELDALPDHHHEHGHEGHHHHGRGLSEMQRLIASLNVSDRVKKDAEEVYGLIAQAEAKVHGKPAELVHFHEVGAADAAADVTAVSLAVETLAPDRIIASPVNTGSGTVKCAHGVLPVPAPATAELLKGVPIYSDEVKGELCTPTGAALLRHFADDFGGLPMMKIEAVGCGTGKKDLERPNYLRAVIGESSGDEDETITELSCNVDDMTGEEIGFATETFFENGALDVYTVPIGMKKSRPGVLIRVMCRPEDKERFIGLIFEHTSTIGIREAEYKRHTLRRAAASVDTPLGKVKVKVSEGHGVKRIKAEYDDVAAIAKREKISLRKVRKAVESKESE